MKGKTHAGIGILSFIAIYNKLPVKMELSGLVIVTVASLLPDIDHPKSIINKYILPFKNKITKVTFYTCIGITVLWYSFLYNADDYLKAIGILFLLIAISSHRNGLTHSLTGMIIFSFLAAYIGNIYNINNVIYYFMLGYGLHLFCDMGTNRGIPLFYPFRNKNVKLPITFKTNSKVGNTVEDIIVIIGLFYIVYKLPSIL
ncbi:metal-dependent hydrolase [Clostridium tetanomorphum]|uniref:Metal-dependent hydrolase n=1 Tax=Clostridium tetanomorphum TaxID=1553 RepID=A0A923E935_CLOTT|nr:metal-dependent hydrolase [Clostridium tetanomorphum]MBC2397507.1 metal-dependent hydrolase [Clostridium tetanomorphum]NRZ95742.1 inner membrane protein [Clostridium tetanomorphum]